MSRVDTSARLRALADHLDDHRELAATMAHLAVHNELKLQPYPWGDGDDLDLLAAWARTMLGVQPIHVHPVDEAAHLTLTGKLTNGTPATVVFVVDGTQLDLLAANFAITEDTRIGVYDLLRLVDHTVAEQVAQ